MNIADSATAACSRSTAAAGPTTSTQRGPATTATTWTAPAPTALPNNNSSIQQCRLADGRLALVFNNSSRLDATQRRLSLYDEIDDEGLVERRRRPQPPPSSSDPDDGRRRAFWGAPRAPMTLALSADDGRTWQVAGNLDEGDGYCLTNNSRDGLNRELSYPAIHQSADGDAAPQLHLPPADDQARAASPDWPPD